MPTIAGDKKERNPKHHLAGFVLRLSNPDTLDAQGIITDNVRKVIVVTG